MNECDCNALDARIFKCRDCGVCTNCLYEYYMVTDRVWYSAVTAMDASGMLCIGCLEARLGKLLTKDDFIDCPLNDINQTQGSARLRSRLTGKTFTVHF